MVSWNCRGLRNLGAVPKFKYMVRYYKSDALIPSETLIHSKKTEEFCYLFGFDNCLVVSCTGRSDDLALLWCNSLNYTVLNYCHYHISIEVEDFYRGH